MCHLSDSLFINNNTRNDVVLICLSKRVTKEGFFLTLEGLVRIQKESTVLFLPTLHVFLILQVTFLPHRLNAFLHMDVSLSKYSVLAVPGITLCS